MAKKKYPMLSELNDDQKGHLAWLLERKTYYGMFASMHCARGDWGDMLLTKALEDAEMTPHQAKIYATRVINFKRKQLWVKDSNQPLVLRLTEV